MLISMVSELLLLIMLTSSRGIANTISEGRPNQRQAHPEAKLLIVVLGGLRWDYLERFSKRSGVNGAFPGFDAFLRGGVRTEYLESVFPSESFPAWQTINTGLYPGDHGIIGNQFADINVVPDYQNPNGRFFDHMDERTTHHLKWWSKVEPIWATGHKQGLKFATFLWGRCDVPWHGVQTIKPKFCETVYQKDDSKTLSINLETALIHFQIGFDAAIVYEDSLTKAAEEFGPLSTNVERRLHEIDNAIQKLLSRMVSAHMLDRVNIVLLSDHGMTYGSSPLLGQHPPNFPFDRFDVNKVSLGSAVEPVKRHVKMVVGGGAYAMIYPKRPRATDKIVRALKANMPGVDIYKKEDIPEHLHWKQSQYAPPILAVAQSGTVILKAQSPLQKPASGASIYDRVIEQAKMGISGYDPTMPDMRGVFMARGPGFVESEEPMPAIQLVDVYRLLCFLLDIEPQKNDSIWDRIRALLRNSAKSNSPLNWAILVLVSLVTVKCVS